MSFNIDLKIGLVVLRKFQKIKSQPDKYRNRINKNGLKMTKNRHRNIYRKLMTTR